MVLARSGSVQRDRVKNPRDFNWEEMVNIQHKDTEGRICRLELGDRLKDIDVLIQKVEDRGGCFHIEGCFLDLDSKDDSGDWYKITITFLKYSDTATIQFDPSCLFYGTAFSQSKFYSDYRRGLAKPSA